MRAANEGRLFGGVLEPPHNLKMENEVGKWLFNQTVPVVLLILFIWLLLKIILPKFETQASEHRRTLEEQITKADARELTREEVFVGAIKTVADAHERGMEKMGGSLKEFITELRNWKEK